MRKAALDSVQRMARQDRRIFFIGSDLGPGTMASFREEMPERFFMEGVSEAHAVGMAAGLALEGRIVFVNTIACFLSRRAWEQVVLDLCLHRLPVRLLGNGGGLVYAPLGPTHTTVEDLAAMRALPNMTVIAPCDAEEMKRIIKQTVDWPGPIYIRLAKGGDPLVSRPDIPCAIGRGLVLREGTDILLVTTGITLQFALRYAELAGEQGLGVCVLHMPTVKPFDHATLLACAGPVKTIVTIEEHSTVGGLGSAVAEHLAEAGLFGNKKFRRLGIPDVFPDLYGSQTELLAHFGISTAGIEQAVHELHGEAT